MLSVPLWLRTQRLQVISTQRVPISVKLFYSKDSSSSSSSDSDSNTSKPKEQNEVKPKNAYESGGEKKLSQSTVTNKTARPFIYSIRRQEEKQFRDIPEEQQKQFRNIPEKQQKPFIHSIIEKQKKQSVGNVTGKQQVPFIDTIIREQEEPFINSIQRQQATQVKDDSRQFHGAWERSWKRRDNQAFRRDQQQQNMQRISNQTLQSKTIQAAEDIASKFGNQKGSVAAELINKYVTDNQRWKDRTNFPRTEMNQMPNENDQVASNKNTASIDEDSWSYKLTTARHVVMKKRASLHQYIGDRLRISTKISFIVPENIGPAMYEPELHTWHAEYENYMTNMTKHIPKNAFEEMIQWTEKGLLWKFPINNEQGMELEHNVHFSEHVFLDRHLKNWCPMHGPVRHFMDLVCIGLSKNPYMTVQEKIDNIMWYRDYFADKSDMLLEVGAITAKIPKNTLECTE